MIQLQNVTKIYPNGVKALIDITLRIRKGEFVFLVGPSGAGKSTLTKLLYREVTSDLFTTERTTSLSLPV